MLQAVGLPVQPHSLQVRQPPEAREATVLPPLLLRVEVVVVARLARLAAAKQAATERLLKAVVAVVAVPTGALLR